MTVASSSLASVVLPVAGVVATLLAGIAGAWAIYAAGVPRRKLLYGLWSITPILPQAHANPENLELRHGDTTVDRPHAVKLQLVGRGSRDVPSESFDKGMPIRLDLGVPIVAILEVTSEPESSIAPKTTFEGTALSIGPSLIGKRQKINFTLLVSGVRPRLSCQAALENVKIKPQHLLGVPTDALPPLIVTIASSVFATAIGVIWSLVGTGVLKTPSTFSPVRAASAAFGTVTLTSAVIALVALIVTRVLWKPKR